MDFRRTPVPTSCGEIVKYLKTRFLGVQLPGACKSLGSAAGQTGVDGCIFGCGQPVRQPQDPVNVNDFWQFHL